MKPNNGTTTKELSVLDLTEQLIYRTSLPASNGQIRSSQFLNSLNRISQPLYEVEESNDSIMKIIRNPTNDNKLDLNIKQV